jgi:hypothetical protein
MSITVTFFIRVATRTPFSLFFFFFKCEKRKKKQLFYPISPIENGIKNVVKMFLSHSRFVLQSIPILRRKNVQNYKFLPLFLLLNLLISGGGGGGTKNGGTKWLFLFYR